MIPNTISPLKGFTLIELSVALVIIGLIVGAVLVGRDLIAAAAIRAQISQIDKYNGAANTFQAKYNGLPGDLKLAKASQFGFYTPDGSIFYQGVPYGDRDGNGVIEGQNACGFSFLSGELSLFWNDLGTAGLIDGTFPEDTDIPFSTYQNDANGSDFFPPAKIGGGNYVFVFSGGFASATTDTDDTHGLGGGSTNPKVCDLTGFGGVPQSNGINYFAVSTVAFPNSNCGSSNLPCSGPGLTVSQAYAIDKKMDDGLPQSGNVVAAYPTQYAYVAGAWAQGICGGQSGCLSAPSPLAQARGVSPPTGSSTTCYDDGGSYNNPMQYSIGQNSGNGINCALSFAFQ